MPATELKFSPLVKKKKSSPKFSTTIISCQDRVLTEAELVLCQSVLDKGGLIVFPTDTVYGLGCHAFRIEAIKKIYTLKGRKYSKALPVLLENKEQVPLVAQDIHPDSNKLMTAFWPGALTLVVKTGPLALHASRGKNTIAVRVPNHSLTQQLLKTIQVPLAATSANMSGKKSLISGKDAIEQFKNDVDIIIDGGTCCGGRESSVVDVTHYPFHVLRTGALSKSELNHSLGLD
jgi:L-threonylcarbamoyladenylate synthase